MAARILGLGLVSAMNERDDVFEAEFVEEGEARGSALAIPQDEREIRMPAPGEYWRIRKGWHGKRTEKSLRKRMTLLVAAVREIDGHIHSVEVLAHPTDSPDWRYTFILAEFLDHFAYEPQGELVRRNEMAALQRAVEDEQHKLALGPAPSDLGLTAEDLSASPAPITAALDITELAKPEVRERMDLAVRKQIEMAQAQASWLSERHKVIQSHGASLASFYAEQAFAATARISEYQRFAASLNSGIQTMGLYLGDDVEVLQLVEGESAPPDEPLTLFQRRLYMDEEYAAHLGSGGATWRDFDGFAKALSDDEALLNRILPAQRCVVAMRYRRREQKMDWSRVAGLGIGAQISAFLSHAEEQEMNKKSFLLIRNGRNVYQVTSEIAADDAERLFPTQSEKDAPFAADRFFRGVDEKTITPDSVRYYEARNAFDRIMLFYRRLMVLMWGLNDRLNLFGDFYDRSAYPNFMSLHLQNDRFRFVYDDETLAIGDGRPDVMSWWASRNAYARTGSRILVAWSRVLSDDSAPGAKNCDVLVDGQPARHGEMSVEVATRKADGALTVNPMVRHDWSDNEHRAKVCLYGKAATSGAATGYLVLDAVEPEDLDYYIKSRVARPNYETFLRVFIEARKVLVAERDAEREIRDEVRSLLLARMDDASAVGGAVSAAVRIWRATRKGEVLPGRGDAAYTDAVRELSDLAWESLFGEAALRERVEAAACALGRNPLRLIETSDGERVLYATTLDNERLFHGKIEHPWVARATVREHDGKIEFGDFEQRVMAAGSVQERILLEWADASRHAAGTGRAYFYENTYRRTRLASEALDMDVVGALDRIWGASVDAEKVAERFEQAESERDGGWPLDLDVLVPLGVIFGTERGALHQEPQYRMMFLAEHATYLMWHYGQAYRKRVGALYEKYDVPKDKRFRYAKESTPHLVACELWSAVNSGSGHHHGVSKERLDAWGYDITYLHSVTGFDHIGPLRRESGGNWGDSLANWLDERSTLQSDVMHGGRVVYLADGVLRWLRGKSR